MANEQQTESLSHYLLFFCAASSVLVVLWNILNAFISFARTLLCVNDPRQRYFTFVSPAFAFIKRHIIEAPLFRKRHNQQFQINSKISFGTLPTRLQVLVILAYFAMNVVFSVLGLNLKSSYEDICSFVRSRTGVLAIVNMVNLPFPAYYSRAIWLISRGVSINRSLYSFWQEEITLLFHVSAFHSTHVIYSIAGSVVSSLSRLSPTRLPT